MVFAKNLLSINCANMENCFLHCWLWRFRKICKYTKLLREQDFVPCGVFQILKAQNVWVNHAKGSKWQNLCDLFVRWQNLMRGRCTILTRMEKSAIYNCLHGNLTVYNMTQSTRVELCNRPLFLFFNSWFGQSRPSKWSQLHSRESEMECFVLRSLTTWGNSFQSRVAERDRKGETRWKKNQWSGKFCSVVVSWCWW